PDVIERLGRSVDDDLTLDLDAAVAAGLAGQRRRPVDAHGLVGLAVARHAAVDQCTPQRGERDPADANAPQAVQTQHGAADDGKDTLRVADVDSARGVTATAVARSHRVFHGHRFLPGGGAVLGADAAPVMPWPFARRT